MFKLFLFTFTFVTELGSYESLASCQKAAMNIQDDFRYDEGLVFNLYCVEQDNPSNNIMY